MAGMKTSLRPKKRPDDLEGQAALQRADRATEREGYDMQTLGKKKTSIAGPKKMQKGGTVRGTGAAIRGKGFSGCY